MNFKVFPSRIKLYDSAFVAKSDFEKELEDVKRQTPGHPTWERTMKSLRREWAAHNLAYALGIRRSKTKDVDLEYPQKFFAKIFYAIAGLLSMLFIR